MSVGISAKETGQQQEQRCNALEEKQFLRAFSPMSSS
jgi:hypothetical protein